MLAIQLLHFTPILFKPRIAQQLALRPRGKNLSPTAKHRRIFY
jgi:hypothetical protein